MQRGFTRVTILIALIFSVMILGGGTYFFIHQNSTDDKSSSQPATAVSVSTTTDLNTTIPWRFLSSLLPLGPHGYVPPGQQWSYYRIDGGKVYSRWSSNSIAGADPATFMISDTNSDIAKDNHAVYYDGNVVTNADPATFSLHYDKAGRSFYADATHVFWKGASLADADISSFHLLQNRDFAADNTHVYYNGDILENADPNSFSFLFPTNSSDESSRNRDNYQLGKDAHYVYVGSKIIPEADPITFVSISYATNSHYPSLEFPSGFFKDKGGVYYGLGLKVSIIPGADPTTFVIDSLGGGCYEDCEGVSMIDKAHDKNHQYSFNLN